MKHRRGFLRRGVSYVFIFFSCTTDKSTVILLRRVRNYLEAYDESSSKSMLTGLHFTFVSPHLSLEFY